ncbi:MAG: LacI family DNA-binding transcriptional regulator [Lachnospiraceae bacterium]
MTIYDISQKAGVSIATVSRVLNGSTKVSPKTRKRVLDVIEENDYVPNAFARGLGLNSMSTIGILCADSSDYYLAKGLYHIEQNLRARGYSTLLCCTGYELKDQKSAMNLLLSNNVDSIVLIGSSFIYESDADNQYICEAAQKVPIMILNASFDYPNVYYTTCDDYQAVFDVTTKMILSGTSDILYLYNSRSHSGMKKLKGFRDAFADHHIPLNKFNVQQYDGDVHDIQDIAEFIQAVKSFGASFHGVIASEDLLAIGALKYAYLNKLRVPEDLAVVGYNNTYLTSCCMQELSSIDNHLEAMCKHLVDTLMNIFNGKDAARRIIFTGNYVCRETTKF